ncbi:MAG TPA: PspC domain-containing protein [bacterium]|nr:PspC domain-containing protein [bacterium]
MKITVSTNLAGYAFHMDEDAYQHLRHYLVRLEKEFSSEQGAEEIIADIEARMAELFKMRLDKYKQVISLPDIEAVLAVLGSPEAISGNGNEDYTCHRAVPRHFYRDPDGRVFGGVCAGLAAYFSINPLWIRILFALLALAGSFGIWLYLILWLVLPEAATTAQKLEMRGEPVTIANIKQAVKDEFVAVKKKINL